MWTAVAALVLVGFPGIVLVVRSANRKDREFRNRHLQSPPSFAAAADQSQSPISGTPADERDAPPTEQRFTREF
jgi:hypothetical protein